MSRDSTVIPFRQPEAIDDPLTEVAREGARRMLAQALIAEADAFVARWKDLKLPDGRDRVVRHGHGPQRGIQTAFGLSKSGAPRSYGATWARRRKSASLSPSGRGEREIRRPPSSISSRSVEFRNQLDWENSSVASTLKRLTSLSPRLAKLWVIRHLPCLSSLHE